jgi:hypothetical protein
MKKRFLAILLSCLMAFSVMPTAFAEETENQEPSSETSEVVDPEITTTPEPTTAPEVTATPESEVTPEPEVTATPEPETTPEPEVTDVPTPIDVEDDASICFDVDEITCYVDKSYALYKKLSVQNIDDTENIIYESSDESVVTVRNDGINDGVFTGVGVGTAVITARYKDLSATVNVTIEEFNPTIKITKTKLNLTLDSEDTKLYTERTPAEYLDSPTWTSSNEKVVTVDKNGNVHAVGVGKATITATLKQGPSADCEVSVSPAKPTIESITTKNGNIYFTWNKVEGATKYYVYRSTKKNSGYVKVATRSKCDYYDKNVKCGQLYYYKVKAAKGDLESKFSNASSTRTTLIAPTIKTYASSTASTIKINWNASKNASGYYIYKLHGSTWTKIGTTSNTCFTDKNASGTERYSIRAYLKNKSVANSDRSATITARTLKKSSKFNVDLQNKEAKNSDNICIKLSFGKVSNASGYEIQRKYGENGTWSTIGKTVTKLAYYTEQKHGYKEYYYYRIRAISEQKGVTTYGPWCGGKLSVYWKAYYNVFMTDETFYDDSAIVSYVYNYGKGNMEIYSNGSSTSNEYNSYNDRSLTLIDSDAYFSTGEIKSASSVKIKPDEGQYVIFLVNGSNIYYDAYTNLYFYFNYDEANYQNKSSAYDVSCNLNN